MVTSTLLYASVTWTQREEHAKKLETAQYRMAHYMLGVRPTDHVRMTTGYETLGMLPIWVVLVNLVNVGMAGLQSLSIWMAPKCPGALCSPRWSRARDHEASLSCIGRTL